MQDILQEIELADKKARLAALDPALSFIVQAPAGSGKTELLIQRYLVLLAQANNPEEIIAITFTRKAAAEMHTRIFDALRSAREAQSSVTLQLAAKVLQQDSKLQWELLENPNRLRIQTIDGLCSSLTRQTPITSQFGAQPEIANNPYELYEQASREILSELESDNSWATKLAELLLHLDNDHSKIIDLFCNMLKQRDQWLGIVLQAQNQRQMLENGLQKAIKETQQKLTEALPLYLIQELMELTQFAARQLSERNLNSVIVNWQSQMEMPYCGYEEQQKWLAITELLLTKDNEWRKRITVEQGFPAPSEAKSKNDKILFKENKERLTYLIEKLQTINNLQEYLIDVRQLPPPSYNEKQWDILACLLELLPVLVAHLKVIFSQRGLVDYIEITDHAIQSLGSFDEPTDLALALDYRIQHILLDEFQDTSVVQLKLLEHLTAGWQPDDGRTLFLVGDPMQSIYRFRKAEVGLFLQVKETGIGALPLKSLILAKNFRSTANIIGWINNVFSKIMPENEDISSGAICFSPSIAHQPGSNDSKIYYHPSIEGNQAQMLAQTIKEFINTGNQTSIAVIVRARTHLLEILPAFDEAGIHYRAVEIQPLAGKAVIQDLLALTRAMLHLGDRIAWLAVLRAPWCGLTLADLHILSGNVNSCIWSNLQNIENLPLNPACKVQLSHLINVFAKAIQHRQRLPLSNTIEGIWLALGGPACVTANELNDAKAYFKLLEKLTEQGNSVNLKTLETELTKLYAAPKNSALNCVDIMTIHKAKGLEFDHVFIPGLERTISSDEAQLLLYMERLNDLGTTDLLLAPIKNAADKPDPIYHFLTQQEKKRADYEAIRLLYVAATRAKKTLHLYAELKIETDVIKPAGNSLLAKLWPVIAEDFVKNIPESHLTVINKIQKTFHNLRRLNSDWRLPATLQGTVPQLDSVIASEKNKKTFTQIKNNIPAAIGTVTHHILQKICIEGFENWNSEKMNNYRSFIQNQLSHLGVPSGELFVGVSIVIQALQNTLNDAKGRWILNNQHQDSKTEYALTAIHENKTVSIIIDRTFVDETNTRWIIDYKTIGNIADNVGEFMQQEIDKYLPQLQLYAKIMQMNEKRPIRLGLYFPLCSTFRELIYA